MQGKKKEKDQSLPQSSSSGNCVFAYSTTTRRHSFFSTRSRSNRRQDEQNKGSLDNTGHKYLSLPYADFNSRDVEAEAEAEVAAEVAVVVVPAEAAATIAIAKISPRLTRSLRTTTMSLLNFPRRRGRRSGTRSVVSCPTVSGSADPRGQFLHCTNATAQISSQPEPN